MFILDTNVVSELRKVRTIKAVPNFTAWAEAAHADDLFISAITIMELELGIYAFGGGEEYAQGYLNAVRYFGDVEYHHVQEMYSSISRLGYGTSHDFNYVRANRRS